MQLNTNPVELTTAATDGLLALLTVASIAIFRGKRRESSGRRVFLWTAVFLLLATGALLGVVAHGLALTQPTRFWVWQPLYVSIGLAVGLFVVVATADSFAEKAFPVVCGIMLMVTLAFYACTLIADAGFVTFVVFEALCLSLALAAYLRLATRGNRGALLLALGITVTMTAALIQASKAVSMTLGFWPLDHNGVFHLVQMPAIILIAIGVRWFDLCDVCMAEQTK